MDLAQLVNKTIGDVAAMIAKVKKDGLEKAVVDLSTGLTGYNLDAPAQLLVPILSPWRRNIARRTIQGAGSNWKVIESITPSGLFLAAEGTKANSFSITKSDKSSSYKSYGRLGDVTWEAEVESRNFEDARARAETLLLLLFLKEEELSMLGGNKGTALGAPTGVATATATTGGSIAAATYQVRVASLTTEALARVSRIARPLTGNTVDATTAPTLDTSLGVTTAAANTPITTTGTTSTITVTWTANAKAAGYAVWVDAKLQCIVTQAKVVLTAINTSGAGVPSSDTSDKSNTDGVVTQIAGASSSYVKNLAGPLSNASGNGIPEIDAMLMDIYDRFFVEPDRLLMGWPESKTIDNKLSSVANDRINIVYDASQGGVQFQKFKWYPSPISGKQIPIEQTANLRGGQILSLLDSVPYQDSQIPACWQMHMGQDLLRLDYAMTAPKVEFEIRARGTLAGYASNLMGLIHNIHAF